MIQLDYNRSTAPILFFRALKHCFNPSLFFVPYAFRNGGYVLTNIFILVILAIFAYSTLALSQTKAVMGKEKRRFPEEMNWSETISYLFRQKMILRGLSSTIENITKVTEFALHISKCAVYVLIPAKLTRDLAIELYRFDIQAGAFVVAWAIPFTLVAIMSNMKNWNKALYALATLLTVASMGCVIYLMLDGYHIHREEVDAWGEFEYLPSSVGILLFTMSYLAPISNPELRVTEARMYKTIAAGVVLYTLIVAAFGLFCYLGLNEMVASSVLCNFEGSVVSYVAKGCGIFACFFCYGNEFADAMSPLNLNFDNWEELMFFPDWDPSTARAFVNLFGCGFSVAIAIAIPSLEILSSLVGIVLVLGFNVLLPLVFHITMLITTKPYGANAKVALSIFIFFMGAAVFMSSTIYLLFQVFTLRRYFQFS